MKKDISTGGLLGGCSIQLLGGILFLVLIGTQVIPAIILLILFVIIGGLIVFKAQDKSEEIKKEESEEIIKRYIEKIETTYKELFDQVPSDSSNIVTIKSGNKGQPILVNGNMFTKSEDIKQICWKDNDCLYFFPSLEIIEREIKSNTIEWLKSHDYTYYELHMISIPIANIEYYTTNGDIYSETMITGGGGGGSSIKGAIGGAIIAGGAGAIIGSREKVEPIKSVSIEHDEREIELKYLDDKHDLHTIILEYDALPVFRNTIPEKDYNYVIMQKTQSENETSIKGRLRKLNELKSEGLITEDEYQKKKEDLLENI